MVSNPDWVDVPSLVPSDWAIEGDVVCHSWLAKMRTSRNQWWERYFVLRRDGLLGWFPQPPTNEVAATLPLRWVYVAGARVAKQRQPLAADYPGSEYVIQVEEQSDAGESTPPLLLGCESLAIVDEWHRELIAASTAVVTQGKLPWSRRRSSNYVEGVALTARGAARVADTITYAGQLSGDVMQRACERLGEWVGLWLKSLALPDAEAAYLAGTSACRLLGASSAFSAELPGALLGGISRYAGGKRRISFRAMCTGQAHADLVVSEAGSSVLEGLRLLECAGCFSAPVMDKGCLRCCMRLCPDCFEAHVQPPVVQPPFEHRHPQRSRVEKEAIERKVDEQKACDEDMYRTRVLAARNKLFGGAAKVGCVDVPTHWISRKALPARHWEVNLVKDAALLRGLEDCLATQGRFLGFGRDVRTPSDYNRLELACAWRLEHHLLWPKYCSALEYVARCSSSVKVDPVALQNEAVDGSGSGLCDWALATGCALNAQINEKLLAHGTKPEHLMEVLHTGMNERFSKGNFGQGCYLAEDCGKCDQYTTVDESEHGSYRELHAVLYSKRPHPGDVHYLFLCRAVLGVVARTQDGSTECSSRKVVWATKDKRELATIPGASVPYHALLVEIGAAVKRYREVVVFHGDRIYPEYLVAYRRR